MKNFILKTLHCNYYLQPPTAYPTCSLALKSCLNTVCAGTDVISQYTENTTPSCLGSTLKVALFV